jgi:hypothetical protein
VIAVPVINPSLADLNFSPSLQIPEAFWQWQIWHCHRIDAASGDDAWPVLNELHTVVAAGWAMAPVHEFRHALGKLKGAHV